MPEDVTEIRQVRNEEQIECLIGGVTLPVPPRRMRVKQALKIDEIEIKGAAARSSSRWVTRILKYPSSSRSATVKRAAR